MTIFQFCGEVYLSARKTSMEDKTMNQEKRYFHEFFEILLSNGWSREQIESDYSKYDYGFYKKGIPVAGSGEVTVKLWVSEGEGGFEQCDDYGINIIEASNLDCDKDFVMADNIESMLYACELAETLLLVAGVPFCRNYRFHGSDVVMKESRNCWLRRKYGLNNAREI